MNMKRKIKNAILFFIKEEYGENEMLSPCYDIDLMVDYILEELGEEE